MRRAWDQFWYRDGSAADLIAARVLLALNALWIVLSRPIPDLVTWPSVFWSDAGVFTRIRFLIAPFPYAVEMALYGFLIAALVAVIAGRLVRPAAMTAALLLYHFADFEKIFSSPGAPFFRGLTVPVTGLFIVAFARVARRGNGPSPEFRWPLALIQLLFAMTYFMSGISKLGVVGPEWFTAANFEGIVLAKMLPDTTPPWSRYVIEHPWLSWAGAAGAFALDFLVITAVFSRRAARIVVPAAVIAHIAIVFVLDVAFLSLPLLLLFVNWDWLLARVSTIRPSTATATAR